MRYITSYLKRHYVTVSLRREAWRRFRRLCYERGLPYSDCLVRLVEEAENPRVLTKEMEELLEAAVRLANRVPDAPESRRIFELWELLVG
mgnify:CR=1 FL=1